MEKIKTVRDLLTGNAKVRELILVTPDGKIAHWVYSYSIYQLPAEISCLKALHTWISPDGKGLIVEVSREAEGSGI